MRVKTTIKRRDHVEGKENEPTTGKPSFINCSSRYYTNDKAKCSDDVSFIGKEKFPKKNLNVNSYILSGHVKAIFSPI